MARSGRSSLLGLREDTRDPLLDFWQLRAYFTGPYVEHHRFFSDPSRGIRQQHEVKQWQRLRKLGQGAWGKVYLQSEREGALRAVKKLKKDLYKEKAIDYLREILAMAEVSKVILDSSMRICTVGLTTVARSLLHTIDWVVFRRAGYLYCDGVCPAGRSERLCEGATS